MKEKNSKSYIFWKYYTSLAQIPMIILPLGIFFFFIEEKIYFSHLIVFLIIMVGISSLTKFLFFKNRPAPEKYTNFIGKIQASSFPSIHTISSLSIGVFAYMYMNLLWGIGFLVYSLAIMYSRVYLKKHFRVDILGGIVYVIAGIGIYKGTLLFI